MPVARPESSNSRIIAHVDMDCFYVQVEQRRQPSLRGLPSAVVQYNEWKGGGLIAVSYEARKYGVKRSMRGDEAKEVCPEIHLIQVPVARGKADLNTYRDAGSQVVTVLSAKGRCERASIDEVYLDLTDAAEKMLAEDPPESWESVDEESLKSHILGLNNESVIDEKESVRQWLCSKDADHRDKLLACGAVIVAELRMQVLRETEFTCSAGIAHNKILAKLASGMNKPAQQTVVPSSSVQGLLDSLPIKKMKQLGGKLGSSVQNDLGVNTVGDLLQFTEEKLQERYGVNTGTWLWNVARGINGEEVQGRLLPKSHGSGKTFPGPRALRTISSVQHWLDELCEDLSERLYNDLDLNKRIARILTLHVRAYTSSDPESQRNFSSKSCPLRYGAAKMQEDSMNLFQAGLREYIDSHKTKAHASQTNGWRVTSLSVSASKIVEIPSGTAPIMKYFHRQDSTSSQAKQSLDEIEEAASVSPSASECCLDMNLMEPAQFPFEPADSNHEMPCLEENLVKQECSKNQNLLCSSSKQGQDDNIEEALMSTTGKERSVETGQICIPHGKSASVSHVASNLNKPDHKRKASKDKGTNSILTFFKKTDSSGTSMDENVDKLQGKASEVRVTDSAERRSEAWSYKMDEIDTSVIDELPPEIQAEFRAWLHPHKRSSKDRTGSSIDHYFSPTRNTHL